MKQKNVYGIFKDGELLKDTHLFLLSEKITPVVTLFLFSVSFACKDLSMYELGYCDNDTANPIVTYDKPIFYCDFHTGLDLAKTILAGDDYKDCPITLDFIKKIIDDVDVAILKRYSSDKSYTK